MKNHLLLTALLVAASSAGAPVITAPVTAAPAAKPVPVAPAPAKAPVPTVPANAPAIDPAALALMDKSAAAYGQLPSLSQTFAIVDLRGDQQTEISGSFAFSRPDMARLEVESGTRKSLTLSDGKQLYAQTGPATFEKRELATLGESALTAVASRIPGAGTAPLALALDGKNLLRVEADSFARATANSAGGVDSVSFVTKSSAGRPAVTFRLELDAATHLLKKVRASTEVNGAQFSNTTTFGAPATQVAPASFAFELPAGAQLAQTATEPPTYDARLVAGAAPFALTGATLAGAPLSLDSYKGKVVLLDFWATWCGPCVAELPNVQANYAKYHGQGFDIVAVSLDEEEKALRDFVASHKMPWPQLFDGKGWESANAQTYGVQAIPFTLLIGKDGKIAAVNPRGPELEPAIQKALAG